MKALFWSDIHDDYRGNAFEPPADLPAFGVLVVAGDLATPLPAALQWLQDRFPGVRRIYVPGNHDWYWWPDLPEKLTMSELVDRGQEMAARFGIDLLMDSETIVGDTRILGATLWTDFQLRPPTLDMNGALREGCGREGMNDYRRIRTGPRSKDRLRPSETVSMHKASVQWLKERLAAPHEGPTMVVTHHAPSARSLHDPNSWLRWCYASDLEDMMNAPDAPDAWLHGHVHVSRDYVVGTTRVIANARGYPFSPKNSPGSHNPDFDPRFIVAMEPKPTLAP